MASYGKESLVRLTLLMGVLLAVIGGQFMLGLSHGTSGHSAVSAVSSASADLGATAGDRPEDDRWGPIT